MKALIAAFAFVAMTGPVVGQNTGPAPQTGMERPENTNGATEKGTMDTTGMTSNRAKRPHMNDMSKEGNRPDGKQK